MTGFAVQSVFEVFVYKNAAWVLASSTSDRGDADALFNQQLKDKSVLGARLVEEKPDPNSGELRDRVVAKRDKEEGLPYFSAKQALKNVARSQPVAARAAQTAAAGKAASLEPDPFAEDESSSAGTGKSRRKGRRRGGSGNEFLSKHLPRTLAATAFPIGLFLIHERYLRQFQSELVLLACVVLFFVLQFLLHRDVLKVKVTQLLLEEVLAPGSGGQRSGKRRRMQVLGVLGSPSASPGGETAAGDGETGDEADKPRPDIIAADSKQLLTFMQEGLQHVSERSHRLRSGRLSQLDLFACQLFFLGAVRAMGSALDRKAVEVAAVTRAVMRILSPDERALEWLLGNEARLLASPGARVLCERGKATGLDVGAGAADLAGRLLEALDDWNGPKADSPPQVTLLFGDLTGAAALDFVADARAVVVTHGGKEYPSGPGTLLAGFIDPIDAAAAAAEIQVAAENNGGLVNQALHCGRNLEPDTPEFDGCVAMVTALAASLGKGNVVMTAAAADGIDGVFGTEPLGPVTLKNIPGTLDVYSLGSLSDSTG
jgi:hypothetical protein